MTLTLQLELFPVQREHTITPPLGAVVPYTYNIGIPYEWVSMEHLLTLRSSDFVGLGLGNPYNRARKMEDHGYEDLVESIREDGFYNPVYLYLDYGLFGDGPGVETQGNGHHRVCASLELGYTHIPVTRDPEFEWDEDGISTY